MRADVVLARCRQGSALYGLRVEQHPESWYATWAFAIDEAKARGERYDATTIDGGLRIGEGFPGCPRCTADSFVQCGSCGRLSCWVSGSYWHCQWPPCTSSGNPRGAIRTFNAHGDH
ncbi:hypothetical protein B0I31_109158 [Saccharothrix carnea]|uniref:TerY-C metal binding domain-containing protein n=1 Tax=Saccharothrix carnea TaxID=1280637 RepID=A0A2P8I4I0_SACCR|nr:hypothetical protein [Saccharothrix carnea]PSL53368.1 hypothetical protein B0I31_109158 [Saccharothrix carnea]